MKQRKSALAEFAPEEAQRAAPRAGADEPGASHFQGLNGHDISQEAASVWAELRSLELLDHVAELEVLGLTVIPPEKVGLPVATVRDKLLEVCERRYGGRPDYTGESTPQEANNPFGRLVSFLALEDPLFQEVLLNRTVLALATQQLGRNCVLSAFQALLKARGGQALDLHVDELIAPAPYAVHNDSINVTIPLTDYTRDNGPLAYVPGSHKYMRRPVGREGWEQRVKVLAPAGSAIIWPRHTWHGAFAGTAPGLRLNLTLVYARPHLRTLEDYRNKLTQADLERNPPRFAKLMGRHISYGWQQEGPVLDGSETLIGSTAYN